MAQDEECRLLTVGPWYAMTGYAAAFPRNSKHFDSFNRKIMDYSENGERMLPSSLGIPRFFSGHHHEWTCAANFVHLCEVADRGEGDNIPVARGAPCIAKQKGRGSQANQRARRRLRGDGEGEGGRLHAYIHLVRAEV